MGNPVAPPRLLPAQDAHGELDERNAVRCPLEMEAGAPAVHVDPSWGKREWLKPGICRFRCALKPRAGKQSAADILRISLRALGRNLKSYNGVL